MATRKFGKRQPKSFGVKEGEVMFTVKEITEATSKNGNDMLTAKLLLEDQDGNQTTCFDNFVMTDAAIWKFYDFGDAIGQTEQFETCEIDPEDLVGETGMCVVSKQKNKDQDSKYKFRYNIDSYVVETSENPEEVEEE